MTIDENNDHTQKSVISVADEHSSSPSTKTSAFHEPQTETERIIVQLLNQVFDVHPIGRHDDFFKLGGNSLLAVKFTVSVTQAFGVRIPPRRFYKGTTVIELAQTIELLLKEKQELEKGK